MTQDFLSDYKPPFKQNNFMKQTYFFQFNVPIENNLFGKPDHFLDVLATWDGETYYSDGRPMINTKLISLGKSDLYTVKDWFWVIRLIDQVAEKYFNEIAEEKKIADADAAFFEEQILKQEGVFS